MSLLVAADRVVTGDAVLAPGWVAIDGDRIASVGPGPPPPDELLDLGDSTLVPGFIDQHVHGGGGGSFGGDEDGIERAVRFHRSHGTTTIEASLVTEAPDVLRTQVSTLADAVGDGLLAGIHLEGPWLSAHRCGAHDPKLLRPPERSEVEALLEAGRGRIRMATLAPELPDAMEAVRALREAGVRVAVGHTDADYDTVRDALAEGADVATHLFNAMPAVHHRKPGPIPALLDDGATVLELVCDGVHVHPAVVSMVVGHAGADRVALVTDAIVAAGAGDGDYRLGPLKVRVHHGTARLVKGGAIAGSTLTMDAAFRMVVGLGVDLVDASRMASGVPAGVLGLAEDRGRIEPGLRADLVALTPDLHVRRVMVAGTWT